MINSAVQSDAHAALQNAYYDNPRAEMLPFVPRTAKTLLDVGCGRGAFAANVKRVLGVTAWGIELTPAAAAIARTRLDHVIEGDVASALPQLPSDEFDCISFNDVLEHLADPYTVVAEAARLLSPGGVIIASLPNVRYFPVAWDLVWHGRWQYADWGVLDRTHLRFFTRESIAALFEERGYRADVRGLNGAPTRLGRLAARLLPPRFRDMQFIQFAVVAERKGRE